MKARNYTTLIAAALAAIAPVVANAADMKLPTRKPKEAPLRHFAQGCDAGNAAADQYATMALRRKQLADAGLTGNTMWPGIFTPGGAQMTEIYSSAAGEAGLPCETKGSMADHTIASGSIVEQIAGPLAIGLSGAFGGSEINVAGSTATAIAKSSSKSSVTIVQKKWLRHHHDLHGCGCGEHGTGGGMGSWSPNPGS